MKLVTFREPQIGRPHLGVLVRAEERILDVQAARVRAAGAADPALASMQHLIEAGPDGLDLVGSLLERHDERDEIERAPSQLLAPLPRPLQIRDALTFRDHLVNAMERQKRAAGSSDYSEPQKAMLRHFPTRPFWYKANRFSVAGTEVEVTWPSYSRVMDYELELAMVIGRTGRDIAVEAAAAHIFGYTIFNDFSARDVQVAEMAMLGPTKSKDFDNGNIFGPCIVTADAFDPGDAAMTVRINGAVRSVGNSATMHYSFPQLIAFISRDETLHAGEIICSGTVGGGCGDETGQLLSSGDVVELEIQGIGTIRNRVVAASQTPTA
jgi:2-keto-4-pentenoate hydratase/2-oxohepta-3-ene-1,7-dioic acid hydratase in catechol pathway